MKIVLAYICSKVQGDPESLTSFWGLSSTQSEEQGCKVDVWEKRISRPNLGVKLAS